MRAFSFGVLETVDKPKYDINLIRRKRSFMKRISILLMVLSMFILGACATTTGSNQTPWYEENAKEQLEYLRAFFLEDEYLAMDFLAYQKEDLEELSKSKYTFLKEMPEELIVDIDEGMIFLAFSKDSNATLKVSSLKYEGDKAVVDQEKYSGSGSYPILISCGKEGESKPQFVVEVVGKNYDFIYYPTYNPQDNYIGNSDGGYITSDKRIGFLYDLTSGSELVDDDIPTSLNGTFTSNLVHEDGNVYIYHFDEAGNFTIDSHGPTKTETYKGTYSIEVDSFKYEIDINGTKYSDSAKFSQMTTEDESHTTFYSFTFKDGNFPGSTTYGNGTWSLFFFNYEPLNFNGDFESTFVTYKDNYGTHGCELELELDGTFEIEVYSLNENFEFADKVAEIKGTYKFVNDVFTKLEFSFNGKTAIYFVNIDGGEIFILDHFSGDKLAEIEFVELYREVEQ